MAEKLLPNEMVASTVSVDVAAALMASSFGEIVVVGEDWRSLSEAAEEEVGVKMPVRLVVEEEEDDAEDADDDGMVRMVDGNVAGGEAAALTTVVVVFGRSRGLTVADCDM